MSPSRKSEGPSESERQGEMERQFENLARMARDWARAQGGSEDRPEDRQEDRPEDRQAFIPSLEGSASGWRAVERAVLRRSRTVAGRRILAAGAFAAAAVVALTVLQGLGPSDQRLSFKVSEGALSSGGILAPTGAASVSFSDGSHVVLNPGARGSIVGTTIRGARIRLDEGRGRFAVAHRQQADWSVDAGPFTVVVHGTVFDVSWSGRNGALAVDLIAGVVTIKGPLRGGDVLLQAGQRLTAHASTGVARVGRIDAVDLVANPVGKPVANPTAGSADGPGAPQTTRTGRLAGSVRASFGARGRAPAPIAEISAGWPSMVASGAYQNVVDVADATGIERCLTEAPAVALAALADAARYSRRADLARRALLAERRRFAGTVGAHDAAFLIGRLAEDAGGDTREALTWYDRYLELGEHGSYASEALGRKMLALDRLGETSDARVAAERYLTMFSTGAFASRARRIQAQR